MGVRVPTPHWASSDLSPGRGGTSAAPGEQRQAPHGFPLAWAVGLVGVAGLFCALLEAVVTAHQGSVLLGGSHGVLWLEELAFSEAFFRLCPLASGFPLVPDRQGKQEARGSACTAFQGPRRGRLHPQAVSCVAVHPGRGLGVLRWRDGDSTPGIAQSSGRQPWSADPRWAVRSERLAPSGPETS